MRFFDILFSDCSVIRSCSLFNVPRSSTVRQVVNSHVAGTSYTVDGLSPDTEYEFRVSAENKIGTSEPCLSKICKFGNGTCHLFCMIFKFSFFN